MTHRTGEEIQENYKTLLGEEFGNAYYHALSEWVDLRVTWKQFESLFGSGRERVDLINRCGGAFWYRVEKLFFEAVALAVCRLSDPIKTGRKSNLTVMLFEKFMDTPKRKAELKIRLDDVKGKVEFARDRRNRRISHNDYDSKIGTAHALLPATRDAMNDAISALHRVFSYISAEFMESDLWDNVLDDHNNELVMLHRLYLGDAEHDREIEQLKNERILPVDLPDWLLEDGS